MVQKWDNIDYEIILKLVRYEIHLRELSKEIKVPHTTLSRRLSFLRKKLIIDYKPEGKNNVFFLRRNLISQKAIINAENYKCIKILGKYPTLMPIFQDIIEKSKCSLIMLFGSYAKEIPKEDSDIDIYIETEDLKIKKNLGLLSDSLSIKIGKFNADDLLIKEIIKNHVIIKGAEEYYEKIKFFG